MVNRRSYYRQHLRVTGGLPVDLILPDGTVWAGTIVDLSAGGISVRLPHQPPEGSDDGRWFTSFALFANQPEVFLPAQLIHCQSDESPIAGLRLLPPIDPRTDAEARKRITAFLLTEQCRERRNRHSHP
jgi:hypothetical protein